jgi:hypothetical protein
MKYGDSQRNKFERKIYAKINKQDRVLAKIKKKQQKSIVNKK